MDSITHITLGVALGEVMGRRAIGRAALIVGAAAQSLPDIDFFAFLWTSTSEDLLAHRGFTHSIAFIVLVAPLLALIASRYLSGRWQPAWNFSFLQWLTFFGVQLTIHDFIDAFNAYGTGWFEPFSHVRVSFQTLFVADPFFTLGTWLACLAILFLKSGDRRRSRLVWCGIAWSVLYLGYAVSNKIAVENAVRNDLDSQNISYQRLLTTPTPLNTWLWWVVAEEADGFRVGFRSRFDSKPSTLVRFVPKNDSLLRDLYNQDIINLKRFSEGYYTVEKRGDTLVFNDLRFGQYGWNDPSAPFVFKYYLNYPNYNQMVMQRGRFVRWNSETVKSFLDRMAGN
jgi:inner membrane protein